MTIQSVGIPWYAAEDYGQILAVMEDAHVLPRTHADFERQAKQIEQRLGQEGFRVVRALIRPADFASWCAARSLNVNADGRKQFASWVAAQENGS